MVPKYIHCIDCPSQHVSILCFLLHILSITTHVSALCFWLDLISLFSSLGVFCEFDFGSLKFFLDYLDLFFIILT